MILCVCSPLVPSSEVGSDAREEAQVFQVVGRRHGRQGCPLLLRLEERQDLFPVRVKERLDWKLGNPEVKYQSNELDHMLRELIPHGAGKLGGWNHTN